MKNDNDSRVSLTQALQDMKMEQGESFSLAECFNEDDHYSVRWTVSLMML